VAALDEAMLKSLKNAWENCTNSLKNHGLLKLNYLLRSDYQMLLLQFHINENSLTCDSCL